MSYVSDENNNLIYIPKKAEIKCNNYEKYKGKLKPKCNCLACRDLYIKKLKEQINFLKENANY